MRKQLTHDEMEKAKPVWMKTKDKRDKRKKKSKKKRIKELEKRVASLEQEVREIHECLSMYRVHVPRS
jgi:broad specificity phosphatase PhoE